MTSNAKYFPKEKVKALRAYYEQSRRSAKGKPEYGDLETTVRLCDQLLALMECAKKPDAMEAGASSEH